MPCYFPVQAWKTDAGVTLNSKRAAGAPIRLPCGSCIGCRLRRSRDWAIRCVHESTLHQDNSFITLTYNDSNVPEHQTLVPRDFTLFLKKLRKAYAPNKFRYYMCGEYGENFGRPHYHAILFGIDFPDKTVHSRNAEGVVYTSEFLEQLWGKGFATVGTVTFESAAYCARYIVKKQLGKSAPAHYTRIDRETGEVIHREREYSRMSRRGGIASKWIQKFSSDVYPHDHVILKGRPVEVPRYYDKHLELRDPELHAQVKLRRNERAEAHPENHTRSRLKIREKVQLAKIKNLKRHLK